MLSPGRLKMRSCWAADDIFAIKELILLLYITHRALPHRYKSRRGISNLEFWPARKQ